MRRIRGGVGGVRNRIVGTDNLILLAFLIGFLLGVVLFVRPVVLSRFVSFFETGVSCTNLASPSGGYSRSMLALSNPGQPQNLQLEVYLRDTTIPQQTFLEVDVIFKNEDDGPIILFLPENDSMSQTSGSTSGVTLRIINNQTNAEVATFRSVRSGAVPPGAVFREAVLHHLKARNRCSQSYILDVNLPPGDYSISATYANTQPGSVLPVLGQQPDPSITTQGVWAAPNPVTSPERRFQVVVPTPIPPAQP